MTLFQCGETIEIISNVYQTRVASAVSLPLLRRPAAPRFVKAF